MSNGVTIYDRNGFILTSYGNGWAYALKDNSSGRDAWFQDDDATEFRARFDAASELGDEAVSRLFSDYV